MEICEIVNDYVASLEVRIREEYKEYEGPGIAGAMIGSLHSTLLLIFLDLSYDHPKAIETVLKRLIKEV